MLLHELVHVTFAVPNIFFTGGGGYFVSGSDLSCGVPCATYSFCDELWRRDILTPDNLFGPDNRFFLVY